MLGKGGQWGGVASALECLSTSALLPGDETGALWEQACSGVFYVQCMEAELWGQMTWKTKHEQHNAPLFRKGQSIENRYWFNSLLIMSV